jgi:hypothetical protein
VRPLGDPLQLDSVSLQERARRASRRRSMANTGEAGPKPIVIIAFNTVADAQRGTTRPSIRNPSNPAGSAKSRGFVVEGVAQ